MTDYRQLCIELFGTDNEEQIRKAAVRLRAGRQKTMSPTDVATAIEMQKNGKTTGEIAAFFGVSRQTVSKYFNKPLENDFSMRLDFMYRQRVCTEIYVDFKNEKIEIINRTDDIMKRAFGVNIKPSWADFNEFLTSRCMPSSRCGKELILGKMGLDSYDALAIIEKTNGRTAEDNQYIKITKRRRIEF